MDALIVEAADYLLTKVYARMAKAALKVTLSSNRIEAMIRTAWQEFFATDVNEVYLELLVASRRNPQLAEKLRGMASTLEGRLNSTAKLFFQTQPGVDAEVADILHFFRWVLRGIALDAPLMPEGGVERALQGLTRLAVSQIKQR